MKTIHLKEALRVIQNVFFYKITQTNLERPKSSQRKTLLPGEYLTRPLGPISSITNRKVYVRLKTTFLRQTFKQTSHKLKTFLGHNLKTWPSGQCRYSSRHVMRTLKSGLLERTHFSEKCETLQISGNKLSSINYFVDESSILKKIAKQSPRTINKKIKTWAGKTRVRVFLCRIFVSNAEQ